MTRFLLARLFWAATTLLVASILVFLIAHIVPADPVLAYVGPQADKETRDHVRKELGLDDPLWRQYVRYLGKALTGDLGRSFVTNESVSEAIRTRFPATAALAGGGMAIGLLLGIALGVLSACWRDTPIDRGVFLLSMLALSLPTFWLARLLQYQLAYRMGCLPVAGYTGWRHLVLPCLTLGIAAAGYYARLVHGNMIEVLAQDYIRTARAKGLPESSVLFKHALRNACLPLLTVLGMDLAAFLGGSVFIESIYALPGLGALALQAVLNLDIPVLMGTVLFGTTLVVFANLAVDVLYRLADPRIRLA